MKTPETQKSEKGQMQKIKIKINNHSHAKHVGKGMDFKPASISSICISAQHTLSLESASERASVN